MLDNDDNHILGVDIWDGHKIYKIENAVISDQLVYFVYLLLEREDLLGDRLDYIDLIGRLAVDDSIGLR